MAGAQQRGTSRSREIGNRAKENARQAPRHRGVQPVSDLPGGSLRSYASNLSGKRQIALLGDPRMSEPANDMQRASIVTSLQQSCGNAYVQRIVNQIRVREDTDYAEMISGHRGVQRGPEEKGSEKEAAGSSLLRMRSGPGPVPDKASLKEEVRQKSESLLMPSPELCEELAKKWALTWIILQKFPQPEEPVMNQLVNALKGKVKDSAPKGEAYLTDPTRVDEVARLKAFDDILKQLAKPGKKEDLTAKEMKEAKEKLSEALGKALDSTKFFPKWKKNIGEKVKEHWPAIAVSGAALVGTLVAQAALSGKWENVGTLANQLPSLVDTTIDIDDNWKLMISLQESKAIGKEGKGTVIGLSPAIGLRYTFGDGKTVEFSGTANLRFATEKAAPFGMRYGTFFGLKGTF